MKNSTKLFLTGLGLTAVGAAAYFAVKKFLPETNVAEELKEVIEATTEAAETAVETATEATKA